MREQLVTSATQTYGGVSRCASITIHETANPGIGADAQAHANLQANGNVRQASWHITVDDAEAIRSYPDTARCWHAGTKGADSIAVEICVNADGDYDKAFKNAAAVVADLRAAHGLGRSAVVQHNHWTGKNCPSTMRAAERWQEFLKLTDPQEAHMQTMVSPFEGRLTANHHTAGGYAGHRGMDIAPPKPGQTGCPVYAAFAGVVRRIYRTAAHGNRNSTWAPQRTGNGMLISNPDGEGNGYNHVRPVGGLKVGDKVAAGELIGYNDSSGNQSGPHLHFEMWSDWEDPFSDYNPRLAFDAHHVRPGSAPAIDVVPVAVITPTTKPKPKPSTGGNTRADNTAIQTALTEMGINVGRQDGVDGDLMKAGVKVFQRAHGLKDDGVWGAKTQAVFDLNERIQKALKSKGYTKQIVDGFLGAQSVANIKDYQRRNGLFVDGIAGDKTRKSLGL
ncbi:peptidoglycan-binding protein [Paeniglutamicibacter terrestris]|uniref:N-acetylmuramoyl-L-alanine amidase n=1 Tax=Paeniglutamicibacter terrestris TaxID=2723403 RepID=A0ABX1G6G5_9MICC|nr:peptidoglycan-binding protein [Paeniglutamicibacter terrestris]NKG21125.1 peptidoglycan DD-metalloendopeptidase family protein [Paeniglutamicibacter terrestris]